MSLDREIPIRPIFIVSFTYLMMALYCVCFFMTKENQNEITANIEIIESHFQTSVYKKLKKQLKEYKEKLRQLEVDKYMMIIAKEAEIDNLKKLLRHLQFTRVDDIKANFTRNPEEFNIGRQNKTVLN